MRNLNSPEPSSPAPGDGLLLSNAANTRRRLGAAVGQAILFAITSASAVAVLFILVFIIKHAIPFFQAEGFKEFFTSPRWYPSSDPAEFGALAILYGSLLVSVTALLFAVPLGLAAAICLSDVLPFGVRQVVKPITEMLASIPSVAYGFFALVILAPAFQERGGQLIAIALWVVGIPAAIFISVSLSGLFVRVLPGRVRDRLRNPSLIVFISASLIFLFLASRWALQLEVLSGTNALNVAFVLSIMVLPTVVSVSEDALQAVGRELREGSYALGATRAETLLQVVLPAARSGICAGVILGLMRAVGETMVVWMASGNAARIPEPWFNLLEPVRTLTATIARDMGEADHVTGSSRFHVLFAMAMCLLVTSFLFNLASEWVVHRERRKLKGS